MQCTLHEVAYFVCFSRLQNAVEGSKRSCNGFPCMYTHLGAKAGRQAMMRSLMSIIHNCAHDPSCSPGEYMGHLCLRASYLNPVFLYCLALVFSTLPCPVLNCLVLSVTYCPVFLSRLVLPCLVLFCVDLSCYVLSWPPLSRPVLSTLIFWSLPGKCFGQGLFVCLVSWLVGGFRFFFISNLSFFFFSFLSFLQTFFPYSAVYREPFLSLLRETFVKTTAGWLEKP